MKAKALFLLALTLLCVVSPSRAKDDKKAEITFLVSMKCKNCKQTIEDNLAFEKGVTGLTVDLESKTVRIEYNTEKTTPEKLKAAIKKLGYTASPYKGNSSN